VNVTENFKLPCLDDTDPAAFALYMQRLAEEFEAVAGSHLDRALEATHQPTGVWVAGADTFDIPTSGLVNLFISRSNAVYCNYVMPADGLVPNFSSNSFAGPFPRSGLYHIGVNLNLQEVGAVTADSSRTVTFLVNHLLPTATYEIVQEATNRLIGTAAMGGGSWAQCEMVVEVGEDAQNYFLQVQFTHSNAASNMRIQQKHAWVRRLGGPDIIEVV